MASVVSSTQGEPTLQQDIGLGNFTQTVLSGYTYTRDQQFTQAYTSADTIPIVNTLHYETNDLFFGMKSAGGRGVTNYGYYAQGPAGVHGHLGGGGGGCVYGNNNAPYYGLKDDAGTPNQGPRGGRGGTGFVNLVLLKEI